MLEIERQRAPCRTNRSGVDPQLSSGQRRDPFQESEPPTALWLGRAASGSKAIQHSEQGRSRTRAPLHREDDGPPPQRRRPVVGDPGAKPRTGYAPDRPLHSQRRGSADRPTSDTALPASTPPPTWSCWPRSTRLMRCSADRLHAAFSSANTPSTASRSMRG